MNYIIKSFKKYFQNKINIKSYKYKNENISEDKSENKSYKLKSENISENKIYKFNSEYISKNISENKSENKSYKFNSDNKNYSYRNLFKIIFIIIIFFLFNITFLNSKTKKKKGPSVVTISNQIPKVCNTSLGLKQKIIKAVYNEKEMREHYGITFLVRFNDEYSEDLYGVLYYQNEKKNLFCMALADGKFAIFSNSKIGNGNNIIQEICYPIKECN